MTTEIKQEMKTEKKAEKKGLLARMKEYKIISIITIIILAVAIYRIAVFGMGLTQKEVVAEKPVSVKATEISYESISQSAPLSGRITPVEEAAIIPLAQGKVIKVNVKVGDYVKAGTVLFEIDKSTVAPQYNQAKAAYDFSKSNFEKMEILYNEGAISQNDYEQAKMGYINSSETYKLAAEQLGFYNVSTPIDGYVTSLNATVGNMIGNSMAASVANTDNLEIKTALSENLAGLVQEGDLVDVFVQNLESETIKGTVTAISPAPALGTFTYPITVTLDNSQGNLMSGMFAEIQVVAAESKNALCLPSDAVIVKNGRTVVAVLDEQNIPTFAEVTTGIDNGEKVEITSGLTEGDTVVISGQNFVTEGVAVNVIQDIK